MLAADHSEVIVVVAAAAPALEPALVPGPAVAHQVVEGTISTSGASTALASVTAILGTPDPMISPDSAEATPPAQHTSSATRTSWGGALHTAVDDRDSGRERIRDAGAAPPGGHIHMGSRH